MELHAPPIIRHIATDRRSHLPFDGSDPMPGSTYCASIWDHEAQGWEEYRSGVKLMGLRAVIRELERDGWSSLSYLIEREGL